MPGASSFNKHSHRRARMQFKMHMQKTMKKENSEIEKKKKDRSKASLEFQKVAQPMGKFHREKQDSEDIICVYVKRDKVFVISVAKNVHTAHTILFNPHRK